MLVSFSVSFSFSASTRFLNDCRAVSQKRSR